MRKFVTVAILALSLSACATLEKAIQGVPNPITGTNIQQVKVAFEGALVGAVAYRDLCARKVIARATCAPIVIRLQNAALVTRQAIRDAETFVRNNPTVNAISAIQAAEGALSTFISLKASAGVQ